MGTSYDIHTKPESGMHFRINERRAGTTTTLESVEQRTTDVRKNTEYMELEKMEQGI